jgi:(methylthio)acryloyl-CoA hydratase
MEPFLTLHLPATIAVESRANGILIVTLNRASKRNALDDTTVLGLDQLFGAIPPAVRAIVLRGAGEHFCAGLDLNCLADQDVPKRIARSKLWSRAFEKIEFGHAPVITAMHGAVIGGGLELACATHIRVSDSSVFYGLPEGQRGIYLGGGGSVRLPRLIGLPRMMDMMLTGRFHDAESGHSIGLSQYLVSAGNAFEKALELAEAVAKNAPLTNFGITHALPRIAAGDSDSGYLLEALMSALAQEAPEAKQRIESFLAGRVPQGDVT